MSYTSWEEMGTTPQELYNLRLQGETFEDIVKKLSLPISAGGLEHKMRRWVEKNSLQMWGRIRKKNKEPAPLDRGKAIALYNAYWPLKEIAADCHCSVEEVKEVLRKARPKE